MISRLARGRAQATKGRTVTLTVSKGAEGVAVPRLVGLQRDEAEQQLERPRADRRRHRGGVDEPPGHRDRAGPGGGHERRAGRHGELTVAKARPEVPDVTTGNPTVEEATQTLEDAGYKVDDRPSARDPALAGPRDRPAAGGRARRARPAGRSRSSSAPDADAAADADADAMRVAVLAGGRSSEHEVSLDSAASVREGVAAAGHEVLAVTIERSRRVASRRRAASACAPAAVCSAPTRSSRCCTARSARTARSRACSSCSTCPTSAPACSPPRCAWTRWSSRRCWPPPASRRCPTRACASRAGAPSPDAVRRELAVLGTPVFVKPARLGSSVGIAKVSSEAELGPALDARVRARRRS